MRKWFVSVALACGCSLALANASSAQVEIQVQAQKAVQIQPVQVQIQIQPAQVQQAQIQLARPVMPGFDVIGGNQLLQADAVFVGRVVSFEPMDFETPQVAGGPKVSYRIAVVQVTESIFGLKKDAKQVRVAFVVNANNGPLNGPGGGIQILPAIQPGQPQIQPIQPGFGPRRPFPGFQQMQLTVGQDGLFTVNKHHKEAFFLSPTFQNFAARENNPAFDGQVKTAKQLGKVMGDPVAALKSDDKQDRYTAAAVLISKYRNANSPTGQPMKQEPIDAAESKLILQALAGGEWKIGVFNAAIPGPFELFNRLGVTQKDGYSPINVRNQENIFTAMQKWLDENNGKYRIQKFVVDPNAKVIQPGNPLPGVNVPVQPQPLPIRPGIRPLPPVRIQPLPVPAPIQDK